MNASGEQQVAEANPEDKRVCRYETTVGTRIAQRICAKQSVWDRMDEEATNTTSDWQRRAVLTNNRTE
jgi:hypothetical protein